MVVYIPTVCSLNGLDLLSGPQIYEKGIFHGISVVKWHEIAQTFAVVDYHLCEGHDFKEVV